MNIFHIIVVKISSVIAAVLMLFTGQAPAQQQDQPVQEEQVQQPGIPTTMIDIQAPQGAPQAALEPIFEPSATEATTPSQDAVQVPQAQPQQLAYVPIYIQPPLPAPQPAPEPTVEQPSATTQQQQETMPKPAESQASLLIISPIPIKGLGREYYARPTMFDEYNYVELGLVVYDDSGEPIRDVVVEVTATDATQNKNMRNTGNVTKVYKGTSPRTVPYYPFHYEFKEPGDHIITFRSQGLSQEVILHATQDPRP